MIANERDLGVNVVHGCFPEKDDSILSDFCNFRVSKSLFGSDLNNFMADVQIRTEIFGLLLV